jgi:hypothetical protein
MGCVSGDARRRLLVNAAAASRKVWIFRRSGGAGARLRFHLFKGYANARSKIQVHDLTGISAADR